MRTAFIFGSFARSEPFRDHDIAIELYEPFSLLDIGAVHARRSKTLGDPPYELDVVPLNDAPPSFRLVVVDTGLLVFERCAGNGLETASAS